MPVSISIGLWTFFITYLISVPLGIAKAVRNGSPSDVTTSLLVLVGFAIPGFVLGVLLLVLFGGGSFLATVSAAQSHVGQLGDLESRRKIADYLWHNHVAHRGLGGGQFCGHHHADQERVPR